MLFNLSAIAHNHLKQYQPTIQPTTTNTTTTYHQPTRHTLTHPYPHPVDQPQQTGLHLLFRQLQGQLQVAGHRLVFYGVELCCGEWVGGSA